METVPLADLDAETRFRARAVRGSREEGLRLLDELDRLGRRAMMKRVRVALDESLVQEVDRAAQALGTTRSAFTRNALRQALWRLRKRELELRYRVGDKKKPAQPRARKTR